MNLYSKLFEAKDQKSLMVQKQGIPEGIAEELFNYFGILSLAIAKSYVSENKPKFDSMKGRGDKEGIGNFWQEFYNTFSKDFEDIQKFLKNKGFSMNEIRGKTFSEIREIALKKKLVRQNMSKKLFIHPSMIKYIFTSLGDLSYDVCLAYTKENKEDFDAMVADGDEQKLEQFWDNFYREKSQEFSTIRDWLASFDDPEVPMKGKTFSGLAGEANAWHEKMKTKKDYKLLINNNETRRIVLDYRNQYGEGPYWVDLETAHCTEEAAMLNHCASDSTTNKGTLFSFRYDRIDKDTGDTITSGHLTAAVSKTKIITELKGRSNNLPDPKYHKYIYDLIMSPEIEGIDGSNAYGPKFNFFVRDLEDSLYQKVINHPDLFLGPLETRELRRLIKMHESSQLFSNYFKQKNGVFQLFKGTIPQLAEIVVYDKGISQIMKRAEGAINYLEGDKRAALEELVLSEGETEGPMKQVVTDYALSKFTDFLLGELYNMYEEIKKLGFKVRYEDMVSFWTRGDFDPLSKFERMVISKEYGAIGREEAIELLSKKFKDAPQSDFDFKLEGMLDEIDPIELAKVINSKL